MHRVQWIEFHEQPWFPSSIRDEITDTLQFGFHLLKAYAPVLPLLRRALDSTGSASIVDLCSGGGGPWLDLSPKLKSGELQCPQGTGFAPVFRVCLTDKYPNLRAFQAVRAASRHNVRFYQGSVDAMKVPGELPGLRTMFTSFHHFSPDEARAILQNAVDAGEGIAIFEITRCAPSTICLVLVWVFLLFFCTPWIRPMHGARLFWTYLVPIIPLVMLFDGVVSCLRTYGSEELRALVANVAGADYQWEVGECSTGTTPITYLLGYPQKRSRVCAP